MNLNFYFLPIPIPIPGILADISRYLPILADISANFTDTDTDIEYFQHTDTRYRFPWIHTDTDTDYFETYRYRYRYQVSVSVSVYRLIPGIGRSLILPVNMGLRQPLFLGFSATFPPCQNRNPSKSPKSNLPWAGSFFKLHSKLGGVVILKNENLASQ